MARRVRFFTYSALLKTWGSRKKKKIIHHLTRKGKERMKKKTLNKNGGKSGWEILSFLQKRWKFFLIFLRNRSSTERRDYMKYISHIEHECSHLWIKNVRLPISFTLLSCEVYGKTYFKLFSEIYILFLSLYTFTTLISYFCVQFSIVLLVCVWLWLCTISIWILSCIRNCVMYIHIHKNSRSKMF